ncbi:MAG: hypothetical protein WCO06_02900 [Candidatus Roizmanbacteria bacterium]
MSIKRTILDFNATYLPHDYYKEESLKQVIWTFKYAPHFSKKEISTKIFNSFDGWIKQLDLSDITNKLQRMGLNLAIISLSEGKEIEMYTDPIQTIVHFSMTKSLFELKIAPNFFSDYPRNKKTGELVDLSAFAYKNRERLDKSMRTLEKLVEGEIIDWSPKKDQFGPHPERWSKWDIKTHQLSSEEIYKYGYLPLTERKEEYEAQERRKNSLGSKITNFFKKKT